MKKLLSLSAVALSLIVPAVASAALVVYDIEDQTTFENANYNARGIYFNVLTGAVVNRLDGAFQPGDLDYVDGKFFLMTNASFTQPAGQVIVYGFWSRGNDIVYDAFSNPKRFAPGDIISADSGSFLGGAGYTDLGPTFGNFDLGDRGFIGFRIRNGGTTASSVVYGFAEITLNEDATVTLHSFGYESNIGAPLTTPAFTPEPASAMSALGLGLLGLTRRRK